MVVNDFVVVNDYVVVSRLSSRKPMRSRKFDYVVVNLSVWP